MKDSGKGSRSFKKQRAEDLRRVTTLCLPMQMIIFLIQDIFCKYINLAEQTDADIVVSNYARLWKDKILPATKHQAFALCSPSSEEFRFQGFFSVGTLSYAWGKLYRREFLRKSSDLFCGSFLCRR